MAPTWLIPTAGRGRKRNKMPEQKIREIAFVFLLAEKILREPNASFLFLVDADNSHDVDVDFLLSLVKILKDKGCRCRFIVAGNTKSAAFMARIIDALTEASAEAHGFLVPTLDQAADNALVAHIEKNLPQEDVVLISKDKRLAKRMCNVAPSLLLFGENTELTGKAEDGPTPQRVDAHVAFPPTGPLDESLIRSGWGLIENEIRHRNKLTKEIIFNVLSRVFVELRNKNSDSPFTNEQKTTIRKNLLQGFLDYGFLVQVDENSYMKSPLPGTPEIMSKMPKVALWDSINPMVVYQ